MRNQKQFVINKYRSLLLITGTIICGFLVYLGTWQLQRAEYKKNLEETLKIQIEQPPTNLQELNNPNLTNNRLQKITVRGNFLTTFFLLDNQIQNGKAGFRILLPMKVDNSDQILLVDRGWTPRKPVYTQLPEVYIPKERQKLTGFINHISSGILLKEEQLSPNNWPILIQTIDYELIANLLQLNVYKFVLQDNVSNLNFGLPGSKHLGYAIQWFSLAILVVGYLLYLCIFRGK